MCIRDSNTSSAVISQSDGVKLGMNFCATESGRVVHPISLLSLVEDHDDDVDFPIEDDPLSEVWVVLDWKIDLLKGVRKKLSNMF